MTTQQVANRLVELCRMAKIEDAQKELFADDAISIEPYEMAPGSGKEVKGLQAIINKGHQFMSMVEAFHGSVISDPIIAGNHFAIAWDFDITMKGQPRTTLKEICVYRVKDGKIISEQFHS